MKQKMGLSLIGTAITLSAYAMTWLGMIYGWGLAPQSWPWIIGSAIAGMFLLGIGHIVKDDWFSPSDDFEKMMPRATAA